jgi:DNA-directed RNA polymerase specialized sigma subunit
MADPDIDSLYKAYKATPGPESLSAVVKALHPTINFALGSVGAGQDPLVGAKAHLFTADAVSQYDPTMGASLPTFVTSQLRQLSRTARQSRSPVAIPERIQIDNFKLKQMRDKFQDQHGREPDMLELADVTGIPMKRLEKIQRYQYSIPSEAQVGDLEKEGPDYGKEAMDYVYHDADHTDRRILEMKTGYAGHPQMSPKDIAIKLNLTPTQLTRRSMRMAQKITKLQSSLESI